MNPMLSILGLSGGELVFFIIATMAVAFFGVIALVFCIWLFNRTPKAATVVSPVAPGPPRPAQPPPSTNLPGGQGTKRICPRCGADIEAAAPQGLCPRCLMQAGIESQFGEPAKPSSPPPAPKDIAQFFPQLEILETLGQGGMGVVYKARQPQLDRLVALKILSPELSSDPAFAERFSREAKALARLNHPNIVSVYDSGQAGQFCYLLMEYVDGVNLWQMEQTKKRLAPEEALAIVPKICDALQYAHDEGIVHRDIKPANILIDTKGRVKIADFGLAKLLGRESQLGLTQSKASMGTPHYMAPEQIEKPLLVDHRADIFSLGVVFYEMLTGELPLGRFSAPSAKVRMDVRLDEVVLRTLEKEPERRYQQASQIKCDVETIVTNAGGSVSPPPPEAPTAPQPTDPAQADARRQVAGPAMGLVVLGILQFLPVMLVVFVLLATLTTKFHSVSRIGRFSTLRFELLTLVIPALLLIPGVIMIAAGIRMKRLKSYSLAIAAGVIAILMPPFNLMIVGLGIGIWAMVILLRPQVRDAFVGARPPRTARAVVAGVGVALGVPVMIALVMMTFFFGLRPISRNVYAQQNEPVTVEMSNLISAGEGQSCCLKLGEGEITPAPSPLPEEQSARVAAIEQMHEAGQLSDVDAVVNPTARSLTFLDCMAAPITSDEFDSILDQMQTVGRFQGGAPAVNTVAITNVPATFLIQNRLNNHGVIEVTAMGDGTMSVRCKLVRSH